MRSIRYLVKSAGWVTLMTLVFSQSFAWGTKKKDYVDIKHRDRVRDSRAMAKPLERTSIVRRYTVRKKDLQRDIRPGEHFTAPVKSGRPPGSLTAQNRYGLFNRPKWVGTIRVDKGQPVKKNNAIGGKPAYGEGVSTKKIPQENVLKINPLK